MALLQPATGGSTIAAGLVVTLVSGSVAAALLWRLVREDPHGGDGAARRSVLLLAVAPCGFFLAAVYTEATFLALAVGAWLAASRRSWWLAGVLAALATAVRVNGLFLTAGLVVMYLLQMRADGRRLPRLSALTLGLPALPVLAFFAYLRQRTGSWDAWREAEEAGWDRSTVAPWEGLRVAWHAMTGTDDFLLAASRAGDIAAVLFGVAAVGLLAWRRRWPEVVYVGLSVGVVLCSTLWVSSARYALTWFPAFVALATLGEGRRGRLAVAACVAVAAPLLLLATYAAAIRHWVA
jgi:hypothetical protein